MSAHQMDGATIGWVMDIPGEADAGEPEGMSQAELQLFMEEHQAALSGLWNLGKEFAEAVDVGGFNQLANTVHWMLTTLFNYMKAIDEER